MFEIFKQILSAHQSINKIYYNFEQKLTLINIDKNQLKKQIEIQKQKILNLIKNQQQTFIQINKLENLKKIKKKQNRQVL